jgi:hypothetical protein
MMHLDIAGRGRACLFLIEGVVRQEDVLLEQAQDSVRRGMWNRRGKVAGYLRYCI